MMKIGQAPLALGAALAGMLALPVAAVADERVCVGAIGPETVDNVVVPAGATCTLNGTFAKGTVKVERGATLQAQSVRVIGNVQGEGATLVAVRSSSVGGSVQVKQGGAAETTGSQVTGDIQYDQESGPLRVADNDVNGSVQVMQNRGGVLIATNTIDGNLQCKENEPPPNGGGNLVHGNAEDQCAALAGGPGASAPSAGVERAVTLDHVRTRGTRAVFRGRWPAPVPASRWFSRGEAEAAGTRLSATARTAAASTDSRAVSARGRFASVCSSVDRPVGPRGRRAPRCR